MFSATTRIRSSVSDFSISHMMRYSMFVPRLYNLCKSLGFEKGRIIPSRAFCSDESQGFPIILLTKHFGAFPFNHGQVGGIVATDRHGPHAHHGNDMVIIQASHVGYDPESGSFGTYCRLQTTDHDMTATCGKVGGVIDWYLGEYNFARNNIFLGRENGVCTITIDNQLLDEARNEGLFLDLDNMIAIEAGKHVLLRTLSTARTYQAAPQLVDMLPDDCWSEGGNKRVAGQLVPELFLFKRNVSEGIEGRDHLEKNLLDAMPWIVTSSSPLLAAAKVNTQAEFDRAYRSIAREPEYKGKRLIFISCLNIDISPQQGQTFPLTKCVPWAAYIQNQDGSSRIVEQDELVVMLKAQSEKNPDQIDLEAAIRQMIDAPEIKIPV